MSGFRSPGWHAAELRLEPSLPAASPSSQHGQGGREQTRTSGREMILWRWTRHTVGLGPVCTQCALFSHLLPTWSSLSSSTLGVAVICSFHVMAILESVCLSWGHHTGEMQP